MIKTNTVTQTAMEQIYEPRVKQSVITSHGCSHRVIWARVLNCWCQPSTKSIYSIMVFSM